MTEGSLGFTPPADCGNDDDNDKTEPRNHLWVEVKKVRDLHPNGYVVFAPGFMGFKLDYNGLLCPTLRIKGIECPKVVGQGAKNYWPIAWDKAKGVNLRESRVLVTVNSLDGRTQDQLHFHLTVLKADIRTQLDQLDPAKLPVGKWNEQLHVLHAKDGQNDDTYVYRVAYVDSIDANLFDTLDKNVATQQDSSGHRYNDRFAQLLAVVRGPKDVGFFLIATQGRPHPGQPEHEPKLEVYDTQLKKTYYGAKTVEALIDRDWKPV